jgi:hypothetical protein
MSITVTATPTGAGGALLRVLVLTGATASGGKTAIVAPGPGAQSITPNFSSSLIVWSVNDRFSSSSMSAATNNTLLDNLAITGGQRQGSGYYSGTVTSGSAVTAGATTPDGSTACTQSVYEVPASGGSTPAIDGSSPAAVSTLTGSAALTTASFTPPGGAVVVAIVTGAGFPSAWTVTDSSSMTWTKRVDNTDGQQVWTATTSGSTPGAAALAGSGTLSAGGGFAGAVALSGIGSLSAAEAIQTLALLSGQGTLAAGGSFTGSAALSGSGTLSGSPNGQVAGAAALSGQGLITAGPQFAAALALTGSGTIGGAPAFSPAAVLSGTGTLKVFPKPFLLNTGQGLSSGTTPTAGNSGGASGDPWDSTSIGTGSAITADNTVSPHGTVSYKFTTGATVTTCELIWSTSQGTQTTIYWRTYIFLNAAANPPFRFFQARTGASHSGSVFVSNTALQMSAGSAFSGIGTFTRNVPLNRWFRVEGFVTGDAAAGVVSASLYMSMDSTTPDETHTVTGLNTVGPPTQYWFGQGNSSANSGPFWLGDMGLSAAGPLGPTGPGSTMSGLGTLSVSPQFAGAVLLSGAGSLGLAPQLSGAVALSGSGSLGASGSVTGNNGAAALSGQGTLGTAAQLAASVQMTGSGLLTVSSRFQSPAALSGSGSLAAGGRLQAAALLTGSGTLNGTGQTRVAGAAALSGLGSLGSAGQLRAATVLSGQGSLGLNPQTVITAPPITLSGAGTLTALAAVAPPSAAYLWAVYQRAQAAHWKAESLYREAVIAGGRGLAGRYFTVAYETELAAEAAYDAWLAVSGQ